MTLHDLPRVPVEDVADYFIFLNPQEKYDFDKLQKLRDDILEFTYTITSGHIWQEEEFNLTISKGLNKPIKATSETNEDLFLYGSTKFGDNIEDEWLIVYLLIEISKKWKDLFIRIIDIDGQFLLIELAVLLEKWIKPEHMDYRVWIHKGELHIIPLSVELKKDDPLFSIPKALQSIISNSNLTLAKPEMQKRLLSRISEIPKSIKENIHWEKCILPLNIACLLKKHPELISSAVTSFFYRDPISQRKANKFLHFGSPLVSTMVKFTRCLFAQILHSDYRPPKIYGEMPPVSSPDYFPFELGAKIALGFELKYDEESRPKSSNKSKFLDILNNTKIDMTISDFPDSELFPSSSRDWLEITEEEVDSILEKKQKEIDEFYKKSKLKNEYTSNNNNVNNASTKKTEEQQELPIFDIVEKMKTFLNQDSGLEGVEVKDKGKKEKIKFDKDKAINFGDVDEKDLEEFLKFKDFIEKSLENKENFSSDEDEEFYDLGEDSDDEEDIKINEEDMKELTIKDFMRAMDEELAKDSQIWESFEKDPTQDDPAEIDEKLTFIKNFMESLASQSGNAGPFTTLISEIDSIGKKM